MRTIVLPAWTIPSPGVIVADRYVVETESGRDGLAAVFVGRQIDVDRRVVIRVLLPQWADDPRAIEQFRREGRGTGRSRGERPAVVLDGGTLDNGAPFVVLDAPRTSLDGELDPWPAVARTSESWRGGSDRVVAGGLFLLGALGTAAFMWLYTTVHANEPSPLAATNMQPATPMQPATNLLDGGEDDSAMPDAGALAVTSRTMGRPAAGTLAPLSADPSTGSGASGDWLGPMRADAGPTVREFRKHVRRMQHVRTESFDSPETRATPAPRVGDFAGDVRAPEPAAAAAPSPDESAPGSSGDRASPTPPPLDDGLLDSRQ